jgi:hypothetical protein
LGKILSTLAKGAPETPGQKGQHSNPLALRAEIHIFRQKNDRWEMAILVKRGFPPGY